LTPRSLLTALVLGLTVVGGLSVCYSDQSLAPDVGVDFWNVPPLQGTEARNRDLRAELEAKDQATLHRIAVKEQLIQEVIAGRVSLMEAAAQFRALNATQPRFMEIIRDFYAGATDEECLCKNVLGYVATYLGEGAKNHEVYRRLNADLAQRLAQGQLALPDVPPVTDVLTTQAE
jgi:hypothetical protein